MSNRIYLTDRDRVTKNEKIYICVPSEKSTNRKTFILLLK